jgi:hypothetical protein
MNILGGDALALPGASMVNFVKPSEYLYGTSGFDTFAQQGTPQYFFKALSV